MAAGVYFTWITNQELPGIPFEHKDEDGDLVDLSSGWTFSAQLVSDANAIVVTQSTDMTGAATAPNLTIDKWAAATLVAVIADMGTTKAKTYELRPYLRRASDSADEVPTSLAPLRIGFKLAAT